MRLKLKPAVASGTWVAFKRGESHAMAMGDLVLAETEVAPVMITNWWEELKARLGNIH